MREAWLAYLIISLRHDNWERLDVYMGIHYAVLDKTAEAGKTAKLHNDAQKASMQTLKLPIFNYDKP